MGAGNGLVGTDDQFLGLADFQNFIGDQLGIFRTVAVGNGHPTTFGIQSFFTVLLNNGIDGLFSATVFPAGYNMAGGVSPEHVSRGSAGEYQADERAGVARLSWPTQAGEVTACWTEHKQGRAEAPLNSQRAP